MSEFIQWFCLRKTKSSFTKYRRRKSRNVPVTVVIFAFCAVFIFGRPAFSSDKGAIAGIEFDALEKDLGTVAEGEDKDFEFAVMNVGESELNITHLRSLCDCVEVSIDDQAIPPGQSTILHGIFRSLGQWGDQEKEIIVSSNAPDAPQTALKIRLVVESGIHVDPQSFSFGKITKNSKSTKTVKIEAQLEDELVIKDILVLEAANVTFRILRRKVSEKDLPSGKKGVLTEIDIVLEAVNDGAGEFAGQLNILTDYDRNPQLRILFSGVKTGDLETVPAMVQFKNIVSGETASQSITIRSLGGGPFMVTGLEPGGLPISLKKIMQKPLKEQEVILSFTAPGNPQRFYRGYIYIITDHPTQKKIKIGVNAVTRISVEKK